MQVSGFKQRNIYTQNDIFQYQFSCSLSNTSGSCEFGFSGQSGVINWDLESGRIYDYNSNYLYSYQSNIETLISGSLSAASNDIWINNNPIYLGQAKSGTNYNYFYINPESCVVDFNLFINGNVPDYSYSIFDTYYSGEQLTLNFVNQSNYPITIFSGDTSNPNFSLINATGLVVNGNSTGVIYLESSGFSPFLQDIPLSFYTNFGDFTFVFNGSGVPITSQDFYILMGPDNAIVNDGITATYTVNYQNTSGSNLNVSLTYISGDTGNYYVDVSTTNTLSGQTVSGAIVSSGYLTSFVTGLVSGFNPILSGCEYGTGSGNAYEFFYATGLLNSGYVTQIGAYGSGDILANITGTGWGNFNFQGYVSALSNVLFASATGIATGSSNGTTYVGPVTNGIATYFANIAPQTTLTGHFPSGDYENINFSGNYFITGTFSNEYNLFALAYATGGRQSGVFWGDVGFNWEPGLYTFTKLFSKLGTGYATYFTGFDPVTVTSILTSGTGIITGYTITGVTVDGCDMPDISMPATGIPFGAFDASGVSWRPVIIDLVIPLNTGEFVYENSNALLSGYTGARTNISRLGNTISGSGEFNNIFQVPFFTGNPVYAPTGWGWSESLTGYTITGQNNYPPPVINQFISTPYLYGSGSGIDSGIMQFCLTGNYTGLKNIILKSTPELSSQFAILSLFDSTGLLLGRVSGLDQTFYNNSELIANTNNLSAGTAYFVTGLTTGCYTVVNEIRDLTSGEQGYVTFTQSGFSGCENWGNIYFSISRSGGSQFPYWGYVELTPKTSYIPYPSGLDYTSNSGSNVTFGFYLAPGQSGVYFQLPVTDDGDMELPENLLATLHLNGYYTNNYGLYRTANIAILDNDACCGTDTGFCNNPANIFIPSGAYDIIFPPLPDNVEIIPADPSEGGGGGGGGGDTTHTTPTKPSCCDKVAVTPVIDPDSLGRSYDDCAYSNTPCIPPENAGQVGSVFLSLVSAGNPECNSRPAAIIKGLVTISPVLNDGVTQYGMDANSSIGLGQRSFVLTPDMNIVAEVNSVSYSRACFRNGKVTGATSSAAGVGGSASITIPPACIPVTDANRPKHCEPCKEYGGGTWYCNCENQLFNGSSAPPECDPGYKLVSEDFTIPSLQCECENRGATITCHRCDPEPIGCDCAAFGLVDPSSCGTWPHFGTPVNYQDVSITDESCSNYGEQITCSECVCCCGSEDGCSCPGGCCCCPTYKAPWGENCACIATNVGC
ncbi:MAG: hypothetical protein WC390_11610 [Sulfurimonas sp.]|jgi:hypothetical protein